MHSFLVCLPQHNPTPTHLRAPSYLNSRLLGFVPIGYIEPRTHYLGNWSPRDTLKIKRTVVFRGSLCRFDAGLGEHQVGSLPCDSELSSILFGDTMVPNIE